MLELGGKRSKSQVEVRHEKFRDDDAQTSAHGIVFLHLVFRKAFKIVFSLCKRESVQAAQPHSSPAAKTALYYSCSNKLPGD